MRLPEHIDTEAELENVLAEPSDADLECAARLNGDVLILGAGGKMGPSLARRVRRAVTRAGSAGRVIAASRFSSAAARACLDAEDVETLACDLLNPAAIAALPRCPYVLFLAGRKFGTRDRTDVTWATNTVIPARVAEQFWQSHMVVFSTGNVYPLVPATGPASTEDDLPAPVGEYAQSCLGRERVVEFVSRETGMATVIFRLNYAVDLRYGTLVDIARRVFDGESIDLTVGYFNAIWQGDANSYALRSLEHASSPPTTRRALRPAFAPAGLGGALDSGRGPVAEQANALRGDRWPLLRQDTCQRFEVRSGAGWRFRRTRSPSPRRAASTSGGRWR